MATVDVALKLCEKVVGGLSPPSSSAAGSGGGSQNQQQQQQAGGGGEGPQQSSRSSSSSAAAASSSPSGGGSGSSKAKRAAREHALQRATTILEQSLEWGLVGRRATFRRVLRLVESERGRAEMVKYADGLFKSGRFRCVACVVLGVCFRGFGPPFHILHPSPYPTHAKPTRRLGEEGRLLMVEALCDVGLFRHALHILRAAAPAAVPER